MKTTNVKTTLLGRGWGRLFLLLAFIGLSTTNAQVGIGTTTPDASAALEIQATDKGLLPPRLTTAQRDSIASPAEGLTIYNRDVNCLQWFNNTGWFDGCEDILTGASFAQVVYVNANDPATATEFFLDPENPTNDPSLEENSDNLYVGNDGTAWMWDGTTYITAPPAPDRTAWDLFNTSIDAGNNKGNLIQRYDDVYINGVRVGRGGGGVQSNVVVGGESALTANTTGDNNVALGNEALGANTTGTSNLGVGFASLGDNTTGSFNVGVGNATLRYNSTGNYNNAIGVESYGATGLTGSENVGMGWKSGGTLTGNSNRNTFLGSQSGQSQTGGSRNTTLGSQSEVPNLTGSNQVSIHNSLFAINASSAATNAPVGQWGVNEVNPESDLEVAGSFGAEIRLSDASTTITANDHMVVMTADATTVTLPAPVKRRIVVVRNTSTGSVDISGNIDGNANTTLGLSTGQARTLQSDGLTWYVISGL